MRLSSPLACLRMFSFPPVTVEQYSSDIGEISGVKLLLTLSDKPCRNTMSIHGSSQRGYRCETEIIPTTLQREHIKGTYGKSDSAAVNPYKGHRVHEQRYPSAGSDCDTTPSMYLFSSEG